VTLAQQGNSALSASETVNGKETNTLMQQRTADSEASGDAAIHTESSTACTESTAKVSGTEAAQQRNRL